MTDDRPTVAILGGLSAAGELAESGFDTAIYDANDRLGGKARSFPAGVGDRIRTGS